jgi:hypothetical protein
MIEGSPRGVLAMAAWLRGTQDEFRFGPGEIGHGAVRLGFARRAPQRDAPIFVEVDGFCLVVAASSSGFDFLARAFDELSGWGTGEHLHLEHYRGHPFIGDGSAPVVVTLL